MNENVDPAEKPDLESLSKYELVVIASREARRLNEAVRSTSKELKRRVTDVAWERLTQGKINYTYGEVPIVEESFEFPELQEGEGMGAMEAPDLIPDMPAAPPFTPDPVPSEPEPDPEPEGPPEGVSNPFKDSDDSDVPDPIEEGLSS